MHLYFLGICGTAMGNTALLMKALGHRVSGSDSGVYPPMSEVLAAAGIEVASGYDAARLEALAPDRVVVGNAASRGNPELEWLLDSGAVPMLSLPQLYHDEILPGRLPVVVTGTHGKTTTASMTAHLLRASGAGPGWMIGGVPLDLPSGSALGEGAPFVIEGDEYDSAFFDKRSKFIHYRPRVAVINNLEFDHADIFRDLADVQRSFRHFLRVLPASGVAIVNGDEATVRDLLPAPWTRVVTAGCGDGNDLVIRDFVDGPSGATATLEWQGREWGRLALALHGRFNIRNAAMAALATAFALGLEDPAALDLAPLAAFSGVRRRQDLLHRGPAWTVIEDFAHHPTAIGATLEALRAAHPGSRLVACLEPRSNTLRRRVLQQPLTAALAGADRVLIGAVHRASQLADDEQLDTREVAAALPEATAYESNAALKSELGRLGADTAGGVLVFFTNGGFDGLPAAIAEGLKQTDSRED